MLYELKGDLIKAPQKVIAHGCNCQGVMGAGVALAIRNAYPAVYRDYISSCSKGAGWFQPGSCQLMMFWPDRWIANLATQRFPGPDARVEWIEKSLKALEYKLGRTNEFAMPRIGCGIGGLDWELQVKPVIQTFAKRMDIYVYTLEK